MSADHAHNADLAALRYACATNPDDLDAHLQLGRALLENGDHEESRQVMQAATKIPPSGIAQASALVTALLQHGLANDATRYAQQVAAFRPQMPEVHLLLSSVYFELNRLNDAQQACHRALQLRPGDPAALTGLGAVLLAAGRLDPAIDALQQAIASDPRNADAHQTLAGALKEAGRLDEAIELFRRALEIDPHAHQTHGDLIYTLHFHADYDASRLLQAHRDWAASHADRFLAQSQSHDNDRDANRRLRIGYVSGDFRNHAIGRFLISPFEAHDHASFEIVCFSNNPAADAMTERFKRAADRWFDVAALSDDALADLIRRERIDILVDLTLHMERNRMLTFARKPAPVQVTYLAYASTSGMQAIDYRLTDAQLDPAGTDVNYVEQSVRLNSYWCYEPPTVAIEPSRLPAQTAGQITFGCLNNFAKVSDATLATWRRLLDAVPSSRIILLAAEGKHRDRVAEALGPGRVEFVAHLPFADYLRVYQRIDIALDPFPYAGGTTSCDALWMGVPIVTLAGRTAVGRAGVSILHQIGVTDWVAMTTGQYVEIAARLAGNLANLAAIRSSLRPRMLACPLCDPKTFARDLEEKFRWMWQRWVKI